jgi:hypothetical protein
MAIKTSLLNLDVMDESIYIIVSLYIFKGLNFISNNDLNEFSYLLYCLNFLLSEPIILSTIYNKLIN